MPFTIGPCRLEPTQLGWHLYRRNTYCGFFRDETEARLSAVAISMLTDEQWKQAVRYLLDEAEKVLGEAA